jgi:anaerobic selenocysteine-containing dehydrogenase
MREVRSFCRICTALCGIVVTVDDGPGGPGDDGRAGDGSGGREPRVVRVRGDAEHPLSRGYTCPKGRALPGWHHHPHRLDVPAVAPGPGAPAAATTWDHLLDDLAARLDGIRTTTGPDGIAMYLASGTAYDAAGRRTADRFLRALGSRQRYTATTIDTPSKPLVAELVGGWSGLTPMWDHERSRLLLLIGTNPVVSHGHSNGMPDPVVRLRAQREQGELWVVDPRRTETARLADRHLAARPGSDHVLLGFLVRELLVDGADRGYLAAHAHAHDVVTLSQAVAPFDRATTAAATGLRETDLDDLLGAVRRAGRVSALTGTGVSMGAAANVTEWFLWALHVVTGSYDQPGGMWFNPGYLLQLDRRRWEPAPTEGTAGPGPASRPWLPHRFGEHPCAGLVPEIEAGTIRALIVVGGNPVTALPDSVRTRAAFARLDVLAVADVVATETVALATHVLPCAGQLERADVPWLLDGYLLAVASQYTGAVVPPAHERWPLWRSLGALGQRLGLAVLPDGLDPESASDDDLLAALVERSADPALLTAGPTGVVATSAVFGWVTDAVLPAGRWRLAPAPLVAQLAEVEAARRAQGTGTVLVPRRQMRTMNSQLRDVAAPGGEPPSPTVLLHPDDAATIGARDGDRVVVRSAHGETAGPLVASDEVVRGVVSISHGWSDLDVCRLTSADDDIDPLTGMVLQSGVPVEVARG